MTFASERIERKNRLSAQLDPKHEVELDGTFIDHLVVAIRAGSPSERQQALCARICYNCIYYRVNLSRCGRAAPCFPSRPGPATFQSNMICKRVR
jgi:hypothetical protein